MDTLTMTTTVMHTIVTMCRSMAPMEACGFIVAMREDPQLGVRVQAMNNIHHDPLFNYQMDDADVLSAYRDFDKNAEEPIAVFHSHVSSRPLMSRRDLEGAVDPAMVHVIFSLADDAIRAWSVEQFVGNPTANPVRISVVSQPDQPDVTAPDTPWAFCAGNSVIIEYRRQGHGSPSRLSSTITGMDGDCVVFSHDRRINIDRIISVTVVGEGSVAKSVRADMRLVARQLVSLLNDGDMAGARSLTATLASAFPTWLDVI